MRCIFHVVMFLCLLSSQPSFGTTASVLSFSPTGKPANLKSVQVKFSEDIVELGNPNLPAPFTWDCPVKGNSSWIDSKSWTITFDDTAPIGTKCRFKLVEGLKTYKGNEITGQKNFEFKVSGFQVIDVYPYHEVTEDQIFVFMFNDMIDPKKFINEAFGVLESVQSPVKFHLASSDEQKRIEKSSSIAYSLKQSKYAVFFKANQKLPNSANISIVIPKTVTSLSGVSLPDELVTKFVVRPKFMANVTCLRTNEGQDCNPFGQISVQFNTAVSSDFAKAIRLKDPEGKLLKPNYEESELRKTFYGTSFASLKPETEYTVELASQVIDLDQRPLSNQARFPLKIKTGEEPALAKFPGLFGVIEFEKESLIPITVRNTESDTAIKTARIGAVKTGIWAKTKHFAAGIIGRRTDLKPQFEQIIHYLGDLDKKRSSRALHSQPMIADSDKVSEVNTSKLPKVLPPKVMEVVGLPATSPGFYMMEIASPKLGEQLLDPKTEGTTMYVPGAFLVTNLSVHLKKGSENALIWVTQLNNALPVDNAFVSLTDCKGNVLWHGKTNKDGVALSPISTHLLEDISCRRDNYRSDPNREDLARRFQDSGKVYAFAHKGEDMSFARSDWDQGIETWRWDFEQSFSVNYTSLGSSVLDRSLLRRGETLHGEHIVRTASTKSFSFRDIENDSKTLLVHQGSGEEIEISHKVKAYGHASFEWSIPQSAKLGTYNIMLVPKDERLDRIYMASFDVQEFRVPLTKAFLKVPGENLAGVKSFKVQTGIEYLGGGTLGNAKANVNIEKTDFSHHISTKGYQKYIFNNGPLNQKRSKSYSQPDIESIEIKMDKNGQSQFEVEVAPSYKAQRFKIEMNYLDPNGDTRAYGSVKEVWPLTYNLGIDGTQTVLKSSELSIPVAALDELGNPLKSQLVEVDGFKIMYLSHRRKIAGGFYEFQHEEKVIDLGRLCSGITNEKGIFECKKTLNVSGTIVLQAKMKNKSKAPLDPHYPSEYKGFVVTHHTFYAPGKETDWYNVDSSDRIDITPDKTEYQPGEVANLLVRAPFSEYTALVTTEREGVIDYRVEQMKPGKSVVTVPMSIVHAPNVFASVLAVRGRIDSEPPTSMVDLGKPAFKLGMAELKVGWTDNRLKVHVQPASKVFKTRSKASVDINVTDFRGGAIKGPAFATIAVVDDGLLELKKNKSWNLLESFMKPRPFSVATATMQSHVVGKRHFGQKARLSGGDGGLSNSGNPRELFDTLLYWNGEVVLKDGKASIEFDTNDSLTSFTVAVIATAGASQFGTGSTTIVTNKDIVIFSGLPQEIRQDDEITVKSVVRNTLDDLVDVRLEALDTQTKKKFVSQKLSLKAGDSQDVFFKLAPPHALGPLSLTTYAYILKQGKEEVADTVISKSKVVETHKVSTQQAILEMVDKPLSFPISIPDDAIANRSLIRVKAFSDLSGGFLGIKDFAREYPYSCLEQKLSVAAMLVDDQKFESISKDIETYLDTDGFLKFFPSLSQGSPVLTAYVVQVLTAMGWKFNDSTMERLKSALIKHSASEIGRAHKTNTEKLDLLTTLEALSRLKPIDPGALDRFTVNYETWPSYALVNVYALAARSPQLANRDLIMAKSLEALKTRTQMMGTRILYNDENLERLSWLMVSSDTSLARLVEASLEFGFWKEDHVKLIRGLIGRMRRGYLDTTTANTWATIAERRFAKLYNSSPVEGVTKVKVAEQMKSLDWKDKSKTPEAEIEWSAAAKSFDLAHEGSGAPWIRADFKSAVIRKTPSFHGFSISKTYYDLNGEKLTEFHVGDLVTVLLTVQASAEMDWTVIDDPVPSGSTLMGKGLGGESALNVRIKDINIEPVSPDYVELENGKVRAYFEKFPSGTFHYVYQVRLNNAGVFPLPSPRMEAMYSPEIHGELPSQTQVILDSK